MVTPRYQNSGPKYNIKTNNSFFEIVEHSTYLETILTHQNSIQEKIKGRLQSGNACHLLVQNLLSSSLLSKYMKIETHRTIILPIVLYGCETWSLTLREKRRLRVFENRVLRRKFRPKMDQVRENGENYIMKS